MFIRYLAEQGYNVVKSERKPRRNMQYKDLGKQRLGVSRKRLTENHSERRVSNRQS